MRLDNKTKMDRRAFLALGLATGAALLSACSGQDSKGSYDDGYAAGYAAAQADAQKSEDGNGEGDEAPTSGIEYTITGAKFGKKQYTGEPVLILSVTAKNVSDKDQIAFFNGNEITAYQDGKALDAWMFVDGLDLPDSRQIQPGVELEGWLGYELIDTTTPVECKVGCGAGAQESYYKLSNPQTIDLSTL